MSSSLRSALLSASEIHSRNSISITFTCQQCSCDCHLLRNQHQPFLAKAASVSAQQAALDRFYSSRSITRPCFCILIVICIRISIIIRICIRISISLSIAFTCQEASLGQAPGRCGQISNYTQLVITNLLKGWYYFVMIGWSSEEWNDMKRHEKARWMWYGNHEVEK